MELLLSCRKIILDTLQLSNKELQYEIRETFTSGIYSNLLQYIDSLM